MSPVLSKDMDIKHRHPWVWICLGLHTQAWPRMSGQVSGAPTTLAWLSTDLRDVTILQGAVILRKSQQEAVSRVGCFYSLNKGSPL